MTKARIYIDSTCFINNAKEAIGTETLDSDVWHCKKLLEAHRDGKVQVLTAILTVAECQHAGGICDARVQKFFKSILTSGQFVSLVQDTVIIADRARHLRWTHNLSFGGADSVHIASALEMGCSEFLTNDRDFLDKAEEISKLNIRIVQPHDTVLLPSDYRQENFLPGSP
jgi:hypothetical protein